MRLIRRVVIGTIASVGVLGLTAGPALAHECVNASKQNQSAGVQLVLGDAGPVWISQGLQQRIDQGLVDFETGEGFHGLIGFDMDGDAVADLSTWIVGPDGEIPLQAQFNGQPCKGVTNIETYFTECMSMAVPM
ncbi:hypothetical protein [Janibacter sp. G1551]|uniref:hypothetical protein n=1 Tax=Janibacter sp. G1551 TaxID=3420440 RepID=UPI003D0166CD